MALPDDLAPLAPTDVISIERMARELRLPTPVSEAASGLLADHIASAVAWVAEIVERPLLRQPWRTRAARPADPDRPLELTAPPGAVAVVSISGHAPEDDLSGPPGIVLAPAELGRLEDARDRLSEAWGVVRQWPPPGGWPAVREVFVVELVSLAPAPPAVAQAVVLVVRDLWHGTDTQSAAAKRLLAPHLRRSIG